MTIRRYTHEYADSDGPDPNVPETHSYDRTKPGQEEKTAQTDLPTEGSPVEASGTGTGAVPEVPLCSEVQDVRPPVSGHTFEGDGSPDPTWCSCGRSISEHLRFR